MEDRRIFTRIDVKLPLKFFDSVGNKVGEGQTLNISAKGIGFLTKEKLPETVPLDIWLFIPDHHGALYTRGEVVWLRGLTNGTEKQRVGISLKSEDLLGLARVLWLKSET